MPTYHKRNKVGILDLSIPVVNKKQKKTNKEIYNKNDNANMAESKNKSTKGKSISFLLGAGFSAPKGYPIGNQLNEKLLTCTGDNFAFSPSGTLVVNNDGTKPDLGYKNQYDIYFDFCTDLIRYYNDNIKSFDYEEFYDYLKNDAHKDPALVAFFKAKKYNGGKAKLNDYLFQIDNIFNQLISFYLEDKDGKNRHNDEAFHMKPYFDGYTGFLNCIETFLKEFIVDVHTLNHDLFFERLDRTEWINGELCDGFEELGSPYYGTLLYDNRSYKCRLERYTGNYDTKLRLYKLHGSIDYYLYSRTEGTTFIPETYIKRKWGIGRSDKIAIIGRSMGNENMKGVKDAYMDLIQRGYDNVEIFDPLSLSDDWLNNFQLAEREMRKLSIQLGRYLNNEELAKTKMFQLNKKWAQKLVEESYTVIDLGDIPLKNDSYNGFSAFYAIEKKTIFGK